MSDLEITVRRTLQERLAANPRATPHDLWCDCCRAVERNVEDLIDDWRMAVRQIVRDVLRDASS